MNKCVFLDRDGTINVDKGYLYLPSDLEFILGVPEALKMIKNKGYMLIVVSNQSGINRGKYTVNDVEIFHNEMNKQLIALGSTVIDAFYICPHLNQNCDCRKPLPGMIISATKDYNIDLALSYMIGNKETDVLAGQIAGLKKSYRVDANHNLLFYTKLICK
ncbi:MAG: HAD family hydrolase [Bacteroidales bacterium]|jgi:D,D-heptose 1,7-bisphosphate phosphatase|nr:HAD family hydrolase [Bacteroidales bacterium]